MASPSQLAANLANAQKSTGPKTDQGRARTRLNAYRHGLTGRICIFTPEEQQAFDHHCNGIREALQPSGPIELDLAQSIAEERWRLKRARSLESGIYALGQCGQAPNEDLGQVQAEEALAQARTWLNDGKQIQLLALYEQRIRRAVEKDMAQLKALQAVRKAAQQEALEDAQVLAQLAYSKGEKYDPTNCLSPETLANGSDFSPAAINRLILRKRRLTEARYCASVNWSPKLPYLPRKPEIPQAA